MGIFKREYDINILENKNEVKTDTSPKKKILSSSISRKYEQLRTANSIVSLIENDKTVIQLMNKQLPYRIVDYKRQMLSMKGHPDYNKLINFNDHVSYKFVDGRVFIYFDYDITTDDTVYDNVIEVVNCLRETINGSSISIVSNNQYYKVNQFEVNQEGDIDDFSYLLDVEPLSENIISLFKGDIINHKPSIFDLYSGYINFGASDYLEFSNLEYKSKLDYEVCFMNREVIINLRPNQDLFIMLCYLLNRLVLSYKGYNFIVRYGESNDKIASIKEVKYDKYGYIDSFTFAMSDDDEFTNPIEIRW